MRINGGRRSRRYVTGRCLFSSLTSSDVEGGRDYAIDMFYVTKAGWRGETTRGRWDTYVFCTNFVVHHSRKINI